MYDIRDKKIEELINKLRDGEELKDYIEIYYIDYPIVYIYETDKGLYIGYSIKYTWEKDITIIETKVRDYKGVQDLVQGTRSVYDYYDADDSKNLRAISSKYGELKGINLGDRVEKYKALEDYHNEDYLVEDLLPDEDFKMSKKLLNQSHLNIIEEYVKNKIKERG